MAGQKDELFNYWVFLQAIAHGTATSLVNFFMTLWISRDSAGPVSFSDYQSFAVIVALSGLLSITMEVGMAACPPHPRGPQTGTEVSPLSDLPLHGPQGPGRHPPRGEPPRGSWPPCLNAPSLFRSSSSPSTGPSCLCWPFSSASASTGS